MKTIVILGMHRSSTSLLARSLHGECYLGSDEFLIPPAPDNPKGFYEDRRIVLFNDFLLNILGCSWDNPRTFDVESIRYAKTETGQSIQEVAISILETMYSEAKDKTLAIKDPRMCLLIDFWYPLFKNPQVMCSFRDSMDIAKSLHLRNGMDIDKGIELTKYYNEKIKKFIDSIY